MAQPTSNDLKTIANLYVALFNRAPDKAGLDFWATALANGASLDTIGQGFLSAPEGITTYPAAQSGEAFIRAFYQTTFGRPADQGGLAFWQDLLTSAGGADSTAARAIVVAKITELVSKPLTGNDATDAQSVQDRALFANKIEYGLFLATQTTLTDNSATAQTLSLSKVTADAASVTSLKAAALLVQNPVVTPVTPTADEPVELVMTLAQLNEKGAIGGNSTIDSLTLTVNGNVSATPANVKGIERIFVKMGAAGKFTVDAARFEGAKSIAADGSDKLTFTNLNAAQTGSFSFARDVPSGTVEITGLKGGGVRIGGEGLTHATIKSILLANTVSNIELGSAVTQLTIEADANLTIPSSQKEGLISGGAKDLSIVITGKGNVKLNAELESVNPNIHSLDASASTGGVEARLVGSAAYATKIVGSAARDVIRMTGGTAELNAKSIIDLGGGDDNFAGGVGKINAGAVIDGGEGYDTISAYSLRGRTTIDEIAAFKNFEQVAVSGTGDAITADLALISGTTTNSIKSLLLRGSTGGVTVDKVAATQALYVYGASSKTTTINLAAPAGEYTINFQAGSGSSESQVVDAGTIAINAENLTLNSGGSSSNKITIADSSLKSLNVTGDKNIQVTFNGVANTSINPKGDIGTATGKLILIGTAAADTFTFTRAATVTGGEGKDVYKLSGMALANVAQVDAKMVSITDFGTGDQIDVGNIAKGSTGTSLFKHGSSAATLVDTAQAAVKAAAAQAFATFLFGKNTYVVADIDNNDVFGAGDVLVELVGQPNLDNAVVDVALGTLTIGSLNP